MIANYVGVLYAFR